MACTGKLHGGCAVLRAMVQPRSVNGGNVSDPASLTGRHSVSGSRSMPTSTCLLPPTPPPPSPTPHRYYSEIHAPGAPAPFSVRGPSYFTDHRKMAAGHTQFILGGVDLVQTYGPTQHISRFLPCVR
jgi:hypothetical protein